MRVLIAFEFPGVDPKSKEAENIIEDLNADLDEFANQFQTPYVWKWADSEQ